MNCVCVVCGKQLTGERCKSSTAKTCSLACAAIAKNEYQKEYRRLHGAKVRARRRETYRQKHAVKKLPPIITSAERIQRVKLLIWLERAAKQRRKGEQIDISYPRLMDAWKEIKDIPLKVVTKEEERWQGIRLAI